MTRQHATPLLLAADGASARALTPLPLTAGAQGISEAAVQTLVQNHPSCLPIAEIDPQFCNPIPICTELNTPAGPIDNLMVTASGLPVLVECKLWRNPESRREVVGQILDYAKELNRWSSSDLQREVSRRLQRQGNPILDLVRAAGYDVDEADFNDAPTLNLRRGRFLLLIIGDGIREGVEAIAEYLQGHAALHFTLGLVEMPIYVTATGERLIVPRVLARTQLITRTVVATPAELTVLDEEAGRSDQGETQRNELTQDRVRFWTDMLRGLVLDDPDQPMPKVSRQGYVYFMLPAPAGSCWLTLFRNINQNRVGIFLSYSRNSVGERAVRRIVDEQWSDVRDALGGKVDAVRDRIDRMLVQDEFSTGSLSSDEHRAAAIAWLRERTNDFVTVLRPRIRAAVADFSRD